ncbi:hypothetical protein [Streptomyces chartreusis]|uniref:hypothetical protein n=1 Tax=Streptomyces chartreusis TaxID=1969 RepID=UPI0033C3C04B
MHHSAVTPPVQGVGREGEGFQAPPNVYHPYAEPNAVYEEYMDPAAAHGWQNAYDETTELPAVAEGATGAREGDGYDYVYEDGHDYADDSNKGRGRRRARRKPGVWRSPRFVVAAGAVGAVSAAALIAGFALSGSSSEGGTRTKGDRTSATPDDLPVPGGPSVGASAGDRTPEGADPSRSPSPGHSASPSASDDGGTAQPSADPTATGTDPSAPTATPTANGPGNSGNKPGRGQGSTKKPG